MAASKPAPIEGGKTVARRLELPAGVTRVEHAHRQILSLITDGLLVQGDRLPSEPEMASNFGVSRSVIREALTRLQQAGVIEVRWGAGSYILDAESIAAQEQNFGPVESLEAVRFSFEARAAFEGRAAALAATRGTKTAIRKIRLAFEKMDAAIKTHDLAVDADLEFHFGIAAATQNPFFVRVHQSFQHPVKFSISLARSLSLTHTSDRLRTVQQEHALVLAAIERGKPEDASAAMIAHLENACRRIFQGPVSAATASSVSAGGAV